MYHRERVHRWTPPVCSRLCRRASARPPLPQLSEDPQYGLIRPPDGP
jgi:hypothetical protein